MNAGRAFLAGVLGGLVMTLLTAAARLFGVPIQIEMVLGTLTGGLPGLFTWVLGLLMHLIISGLIAVLYAAGFEYVVRMSGWVIGVGFALVHVAIGGMLLGVLPAIHPLMPDPVAAPGFFFLRQGRRRGAGDRPAAGRSSRTA